MSELQLPSSDEVRAALELLRHIDQKTALQLGSRALQACDLHAAELLFTRARQNDEAGNDRQVSRLAVIGLAETERVRGVLDHDVSATARAYMYIGEVLRCADGSNDEVSTWAHVVYARLLVVDINHDQHARGVMALGPLCNDLKVNDELFPVQILVLLYQSLLTAIALSGDVGNTYALSTVKQVITVFRLDKPLGERKCAKLPEEVECEIQVLLSETLRLCGERTASRLHRRKAGRCARVLNASGKPVFLRVFDQLGWL